jgi:hypothetical protein
MFNYILHLSAIILVLINFELGNIVAIIGSDETKIIEFVILINLPL